MREFKTMKECFLFGNQNWNFSRFLAEFHCWFDKFNQQHNGALFHDTVYDNSTEKNDQLIWDVETPSEKICDELGLYWWPCKIGHMCCPWANLSDEGVDIVIDKFEKFLDGNPDNDLIERLRISRLAAVEKEIKEKKDALQKLETERDALNISPEQVELNRKYLGKWIIAECTTDTAIYHVNSIKHTVEDGYGAIIISADHAFMFSSLENQEGHDNLGLTACERPYVKIYDSTNRIIVDDPMPFIQKSLASINTWLTEYIKEGQV